MNQREHPIEKPHSFGFTLIEILVALGIFTTLTSITIISLDLPGNFQKSYDITRKSDIQELHKAFIRYFADHRCYPTELQYSTLKCGEAVPEVFAPYLSKFPCDPETNEKYHYEPIDRNCSPCNGSCGTCTGQRILTRLKKLKDSSGKAAGCDEEQGCGVISPDGTPYNYGVTTSGNSCSVPTQSPTPTLAPTSTTIPTQIPTHTNTPTLTPSPTPMSCAWSGGAIVQNGSFESDSDSDKVPDCWRLSAITPSQLSPQAGRTCTDGSVGNCAYTQVGGRLLPSASLVADIWQMNTISGNAGETISFSFDVKATRDASASALPTYSGAVRIIRSDGTSEIIRIWLNTFPENTWTHFQSSLIRLNGGATSQTTTRPYIRLDVYLNSPPYDRRIYSVDNVIVTRSQ